MNRIGRLGAAFILGLGVSHFFDPQSGRRRRALVRDRLVHDLRVTGDGLELAVSDLAHRSHGVIAAARGWLLREPASDQVLAERIRAKLGRVAVHARAFDVACTDGHVELRGDVLEREADAVLDVVRAVPGVRSVTDHLERHAAPDVPQLQGIPRVRRRMRLEDRWRPATRLVVGSAALLALLRGRRARTPIDGLALIAGSGGLLRSLTNRSFRELAGLGPHETVTLRKSVLLHAPLEQVYARWVDLESFPRFMVHVADVRKRDASHYHCKVIGPAGVPLQWEITVIERAPNARMQLVAVSSFARVYAFVRFEEQSKGATRLSIELTYAPPLGVIGHSVASLFGFGPGHEVDEDLLRFKSLVEHGRARGRNGVVTLNELETGRDAAHSSGA